LPSYGHSPATHCRARGDFGRLAGTNWLEGAGPGSVSANIESCFWLSQGIRALIAMAAVIRNFPLFPLRWFSNSAGGEKRNNLSGGGALKSVAH